MSLYLQNYKEFEAEILDLQLVKYRLSFNIKKCTTCAFVQLKPVNQDSFKGDFLLIDMLFWEHFLYKIAVNRDSYIMATILELTRRPN